MLALLAQASARHDHESQSVKGKWGSGVFSRRGEVARAAVIRALAETHVELALIHPLREGNGRLAPVLSTLMALQAGLQVLDFSVIAVEKKKEYFTAV